MASKGATAPSRSTLAPNARQMVEAGYELKAVRSMDMFPQTPHVVVRGRARPLLRVELRHGQREARQEGRLERVSPSELEGEVEARRIRL